MIFTAYTLAGMADCGSPESIDSPGAVFLLDVQDAYNSAVTYNEYDGDDSAHTIADAAPSVYTYEKWSQFTDLAAWEVDIMSDGLATGDMDKDASIALYCIALRLVLALETNRVV